MGPRVVECLRTPPSRDEPAAATQAAGLTAREAPRREGTPHDELGLDDPSPTDDAVLAHPVPINRPFVFTERGVRLYRPSERVLDILPDPRRGAFAKEDDERAVDEASRRVTPRSTGGAAA